MIKLLDINKNVLHLITKVKDYYIDSDLRTGDKLLSFSIPRIDPAAASLKQELYLRTATDEYVIKEINYLNRDFTEVFAKLNLDGLKSVKLRGFDSTGKNLPTFLTSALAGTDWTFQMVDAITKLRTVRAEESTVFDLIAEASKVYNIEPEFDTLNKVVKIYQTRGTDRGAYAFTDLNIKSADFQSDTYDLVTRIYPYGADGLTIAAVNGGVTYVEDFSFTDKVVEYHWVDERYTDAATLKEDAINKLTALCKPRVSIKLAVLDLARVSNQYSYLDYRLGDLITVLDKSAKQVYHERIMRLTEYPLEPERNVVEMSNTMLSFAEMQKEASKNVENIVTSIDIINKDMSNFDAAVEEVSEMIKSGYGGYVVTRYNAENQPYEILILDNPDLLLAQNVIRLNANGLAFSTTGYNGTYDTAITIDGRILGRFIDTASLSAISANLGEITSGTIDANLVTVKNIKAEHITLGAATTYEPGYDPTIIASDARQHTDDIENSLQGQIDTVSDVVTTNTNDISALGTTITEETTIDGVPLKTYTADLSAKQLRFTESLGVLNLFKNSNDEYQEISFTDRTFLQPIPVGGTSPLQPNNSITLSAYVTTTNKEIAIGVKQSALSDWEGETMWEVDEEGATVYIPPYSEGVLRITCLISPEADHVEPMFYSGDLVEETTVLYKEMMLTLGTSSYPWTPYLGDIAQVASNAAIGVVDGALMTTVNAEKYAQDLAAIGAFLKGELTAAQAVDGKDESVGAVVQGLDAWVYAINELESVTDSHDTTVGDIIKFFKFDTNFLTIGKSTSNLKVNITNEAVNFIEGSTKIAWISGQQLNIKSAVIYDDAEIIDIRWSRMEGHTVLTWAGA